MTPLDLAILGAMTFAHGVDPDSDDVILEFEFRYGPERLELLRVSLTQGTDG